MKLYNTFVFFSASLAAFVCRGQQVGHQKPNLHLPLTIKHCTSSGCTDEPQKVTLDANWRWVHKVNTYTNCYTGTTWDKTLCPDPKTCTQNCAVDGVPESDWSSTYGISSGGDSLTLKYEMKDNHGNVANVGSRTYLMDGDSKYKMFKLKNREFTFDVDVNKLPCGLNGALYFVEMQADGGSSEFPTDKAGAAFGTGYCDAQCPHDVKFISGEANILNWTNGQGQYGSCCNEMDIWEANAQATAYTPHVCVKDGPYRCDGEDCGDTLTSGTCDKAGCDFNSYRVGDKTFFGNGSAFAVDSSKLMTVVTQFVTSDGTDDGDLVEIRRVFVQDGKVIPTRNATLTGLTGFNSVSESFCDQQKTIFGDKNSFKAKGGLKRMGDALARGMVLVMSLWDDSSVNMLWLDSDFPTDQPATKPGVARGPCSTSSGKPDDCRKKFPDAAVTYSNIKYGAIGSTYGPSPSPPTPPAPSGCHACGYNCHGNCNTCGHCNTKPGCDSKSQCLGTCNTGNNAMWCGGGSPSPSPPSPAPSPSPPPSGCPGGSLPACIKLCPSNPPSAYKVCVQSCVERCK